ncbi:MAG: NADPH-dependent FMN reductase [Bacteroidota bacterium]
MKIAIILGSVREERKTHLICYYVAEQLSNIPGISLQLIDLANVKLPILTQRWQQQSEPDTSLVDTGLILQEADGIIFASPEYHGSYTGVLKNAIDHYWGEFKRKPIGVISVGAGKMAGINGSMQLQHLILSIGAYAMPYKLLVPFIKDAFDEQGQPKSEELVKQTETFIQEFLWFTRAISQAKEVPV